MPDFASEPQKNPRLRDPVPNELAGADLPSVPNFVETELEEILSKRAEIGPKEIEALIAIAEQSPDTSVANKAFATLEVASEKLTPYLGQIIDLALRGYINESDRWGPGAWSTAIRLLAAAATATGREHICDKLENYNERELHLVLAAIKESGPLDRVTEFRIKSLIAKTEVAPTGLKFYEPESRAAKLLSFLIAVERKDAPASIQGLQAPYDPENPLRETPAEISAVLSRYAENAVLLIARGLNHWEFHWVKIHLNDFLCAQGAEAERAIPALKEAILKERILQPMPDDARQAISILTRLKAKSALLDCLLPDSDPRLQLPESDPGYYRDVQAEIINALKSLGVKLEAKPSWLKSFLVIFSSEKTGRPRGQEVRDG